MMKHLLVIFTSLVIGGVIVYFLEPVHNIPSDIRVTEVSHQCSCIEDNPKYQLEVLDAAQEVNQKLAAMTKKFTNENDLVTGDFDAVFIPGRNGSYTMRVICSNRSSLVMRLREMYEERISTCLGPHERVLEQAHSKDKNEAQQGASDRQLAA